MEYRKPEEVGISSRNILKFVKSLEENRLATHSVIISRGDSIVFEKYWEPFDREFLHRMYSVSKSFVSIAMGFLEQEGKIDLDAPICSYFPEECANQEDELFKNQTIRHMLMMSTAKTPKNWFNDHPADRVKYYFENDTPSRPSGMFFEYDSTGSFVMGALVERITGKSLTEYLQEKLFSKIGASDRNHFLLCPGGHSWGDSALLCRPIDLWRTARFVMNKGKWNGEQILNEAYVTAATSRQIDTNAAGINDTATRGYGYQFWRLSHNAYYFNGMGCQYGICVPDQDIIMVYNADNQGMENVRRVIFDKFFELLVEEAKNEPLSVDQEAEAALEEYTKGLKLMTAEGEPFSSRAAEVNGKLYRMKENPMGISQVKLTFDGNKGNLWYVNAQGEKNITFGLGYNEFGLFPQEGYADQMGNVVTKGRFYKCAASAGWAEEHKLLMKVQIIDEYFGNLNMVISFKDNNIMISMTKVAEDFLNEYQGYAWGSIEQ